MLFYHLLAIIVIIAVLILEYLVGYSCMIFFDHLLRCCIVIVIFGLCAVYASYTHMLTLSYYYLSSFPFILISNYNKNFEVTKSLNYKS